MKNALYWLWMQKSFGFGANIGDVVSYFSSAKQLYEAGEEAWLDSRLFGNDLINVTSKRIESMKSVPLSFGEEIISYCEQNGIGILTPEDSEYPASLLKTRNYPAVLFFRGDASVLGRGEILAVIGTRKPSDYGKNACKKISADLVRNGYVIISGGALGIDSAAHKACVELDSPTILVMGTGLDSGYLMENEPLRQRIAERGCLISEYPPKTFGTAGSFPLRNRIVAALAEGIVVFEAGEKSGTLNTCVHAKKLGKPIFVLPGSIDSELYVGSNALIDEGATPVFSAESILRFFDKTVYTSDPSPKGRTPFSGIDSFTEVEGEPFGMSRTERLSRLKKAKEKLSAPSEKPEESVSRSEKVESAASAPAAEKEPFIEEGFSENAALIFKAMKDGSTAFDEIVRNASLPPHLVMRGLTELEMEGVISKINSLEYKIN